MLQKFNFFCKKKNCKLHLKSHACKKKNESNFLNVNKTKFQLKSCWIKRDDLNGCCVF